MRTHAPASTAPTTGRPASRGPARRGALALLAAIALAAPAAGCLGKPPIEDRWTRLDVESSSLAPNQTLTPGDVDSVTVRARITYRSILTGFCVVELRASDSLGVADLVLHPEAPRLPMAHDIDRLLANSVSLGRATREVTGWDHLIQPLTLTFGAAAPPDSLVAGRGLFLVCYLGSGEEMQLPGGRDSVVITPFLSDDRQVLPVGMEFSMAGPVP